MQRRGRRAIVVGLAVAALTGIGGFGLDRYVAAADRHNVAEALDERMIAFRRDVAANDLSQASAQPFVKLVVGAGVRLASPNAEGVKIPSDWIDDGAAHSVSTKTGEYLVLTRRITVDGLLATASVGEPATSSPGARSALRRGLVLLDLLSGLAAGAMTLLTTRQRRQSRVTLAPPTPGERSRSAPGERPQSDRSDRSDQSDPLSDE